MESRKITIVSTKTQKKSVIMSEAETLSELKVDLINAGINFTDMTFFEGTSKTELKSDESILPKDVPYTNRTTGETKITNELVFMLTNPNKKIKSGCMTRKEVYDIIKEKGLAEACLSTFGKNFTQCKTSDLIDLIQSFESVSQSIKECTCTNKCVDIKAREAIIKLAEILYDEDYIYKEDKEAVIESFMDVATAPKQNSSYSDDEIDNMFAGMC